MKTHKITHPGLVSVEDLSSILNLSQEHIRRMVRENKIPHYRSPGKHTRINFDIVEVLRLFKGKNGTNTECVD